MPQYDRTVYGPPLEAKFSYICRNFVSITSFLGLISFLGLMNCNTTRTSIRINMVPFSGKNVQTFKDATEDIQTLFEQILSLISVGSVCVAERLALPTSDHGVAGSNPAGGEILPEPKRRFIAQSLSCSPFHRLEMTEILLKGCKILTHPLNLLPVDF